MKILTNRTKITRTNMAQARTFTETPRLHTVTPRIHMAVKNNYGGTQNSYGGTQNTYGYNNQPQYQSGMENQQRGACATDECWTVDADLFIGEHSNCKYRYVYYLADRKKIQKTQSAKTGQEDSYLWVLLYLELC